MYDRRHRDQRLWPMASTPFTVRKNIMITNFLLFHFFVSSMNNTTYDMHHPILRPWPLLAMNIILFTFLGAMAMNITDRICLIITHLPSHALDLLHHLLRLPHLSLSARRELLLGVNLRQEANTNTNTNTSTKRGVIFSELRNHVRDVVSYCPSQLLQLSAN